MNQRDLNRAPGRYRLKLLLVLGVAVGIPLGFGVLYYFPPGESSFYPRCLFHMFTGLHCPGCGLTRCFHALAHGDLLQALAYNALFFFMLIPLGWLGWQQVRAWRNQAVQPRPMPAWVIRILVWIVVVFGILRNVKFFPFTLLAPHELS